MQKVVLDNGLTIIYVKKPGNSVVIEVMVNVGSNHENSQERGIAHFLEHILFEGTTKRPTNQLITNEIERIGGDFNAYTTGERTNFYVKVLKKHFAVAADILSDVMLNSLFKKEHVEKEKNIVLKEIDMVNDEPRFYQWLLLQKNIFKKHPAQYPTYGDRKLIEKLTREKVVAFFDKHYVASNMVLAIVGDVPNWRKVVQNKFSFVKKKSPELVKVKEPVAVKNKVVREKRDIANTYFVLGFKTVPKSHKDSVVLDVINGILGRGQSGRLFNEIRSKRALAYDVGSQNISERTFGYFAAYATIDKKNVNLVKKLIMEELAKLDKVSEKDIRESKTFIEGDYLLGLEDVQKLSDELLFWEQVGGSVKEYLRDVKKVSIKDVKRVVKKYFKNYTLAVLEGN